MKVHRKLLESNVWRLPALDLKLWVWILLSASASEYDLDNGIHLEPGEFVTTYARMREALATDAMGPLPRHVPSMKEVRVALRHHKERGTVEVGQALGQTGLHIKVLHWNEYQDRFDRTRADSKDEVGQGKGRARALEQEEEKKRSKKKDTTNAHSGNGNGASSVDFDTFWAAYPKKVGKGTARTAYARAVRKANASVILEAIKGQTPAMLENPEYIPHPTTWLNGERWEDDQGGKTLDDIKRVARLREMARASGEGMVQAMLIDEPEVWEEVQRGL